MSASPIFAVSTIVSVPACNARFGAALLLCTMFPLVFSVRVRAGAVVCSMRPFVPAVGVLKMMLSPLAPSLMRVKLYGSAVVPPIAPLPAMLMGPVSDLPMVTSAPVPVGAASFSRNAALMSSEMPAGSFRLIDRPIEAVSKSTLAVKMAGTAVAVVVIATSETIVSVPTAAPVAPMRFTLTLPPLAPAAAFSVRFRPAPVTAPPREILPPPVPPDVVIPTFAVSAIAVLKEIPAFAPEDGATVIFPLTLLVPAPVWVKPPSTFTAPPSVRMPLLTTLSAPDNVTVEKVTAAAVTVRPCGPVFTSFTTDGNTIGWPLVVIVRSPRTTTLLVAKERLAAAAPV